MFYVLSGDHSFVFEPSTENPPGGTRFVNSEIFLRLNKIVMRLSSPEGMFQETCDKLKVRVEEIKMDGAQA